MDRFHLGRFSSVSTYIGRGSNSPVVNWLNEGLLSVWSPTCRHTCNRTNRRPRQQTGIGQSWTQAESKLTKPKWNRTTSQTSRGGPRWRTGKSISMLTWEDR
eukprot:1191951-Prorocentrum_minimum.AAC.2